MNKIKNPILRGFNPDPSIIRVDNDYYIATSTFEWFPGVQIHHSKDLINWELVTRPLNRVSQLDLAGIPDSCGVWAPCLSYSEGIFYLVYSNVRSFDGVWKDTPNFLVTTNDILGDWSEPIFLSSSGFDGSLFHDDDGRKWFTSMITDHRKGKFFGGIILQEYSIEKERLVGPVYPIFKGSTLGITEAPHIYKRNGYYYLITAEGGTEYGHAVSLARSKSIFGPYELHPQNPIISTRNHPKAPLQKCGHADLVETPEGDWFSVFLTGRPLTELGRCTLGRETAIEEMEWREDDWLYLKEGEMPRLQVPIGNRQSAVRNLQTTQRVDFDSDILNIHFQSLRVPISEDWLSLNFRNGYLRLFGRESLSSLHYQSLIARRVQAFNIGVSTCLEFEPISFQQMAGLVCYYNTAHWFYLNVIGGNLHASPTPAFSEMTSNVGIAGRNSPLGVRGEHRQKFLQITTCDNFKMTDILENPIEVSGVERIYLKAKFNRENLQFYYATEENKWQKIGDTLDGSILSDDYVQEGSSRYRPAFTGAFVGICCQDLSGQKLHADFDWFEYQELE